MKTGLTAISTSDAINPESIPAIAPEREKRRHESANRIDRHVRAGGDRESEPDQKRDVEAAQ